MEKSIINYSKTKKSKVMTPMLHNLSVAEDISQVKLIKRELISCENTRWDMPVIVADNMRTIFQMDMLADEYIYMVALDNAANVLGIMEISHGGVNLSYCSPREVFQAALLMNASVIVMVHNHTSGNCVPSEADITLEKILKEAGKLIGIELIDFIIVGGNSYYSSKENEKGE